MNFTEIALARQSCRKYDPTRDVEQEKLDAILNTARIAPSACNAQPYHITVCRGETARKIGAAVQEMGLNKFATDVPVMLVISEADYNANAALGAKIKHNDYRSIDIGIVAAYITSEATAQGLETCIIGWLDDKKVRDICGANDTVRLIISVGYPREDYKQYDKRRKDNLLYL